MVTPALPDNWFRARQASVGTVRAACNLAEHAVHDLGRHAVAELPNLVRTCQLRSCKNDQILHSPGLKHAARQATPSLCSPLYKAAKVTWRLRRRCDRLNNTWVHGLKLLKVRDRECLCLFCPSRQAGRLPTFLESAARPSRPWPNLGTNTCIDAS